MKRLQMLIVFVVLFSMVLGACAPAAPAAPAATSAPAQATQAQPSTSTEKTPLVIWYWGEQEAPGMKNFMDQAVKMRRLNDRIPSGMQFVVTNTFS